MLDKLSRSGSVCGERNRVNVSSLCDSSTELKDRNVMNERVGEGGVEEVEQNRRSGIGRS